MAKIQFANLFFQPVNKLGLIRFQICPGFQGSGKLLSILLTKQRTVSQFLPTGNHSRCKGKTGRQVTAFTVGFFQLFVNLKRR